MVIQTLLLEFHLSQAWNSNLNGIPEMVIASLEKYKYFGVGSLKLLVKSFSDRINTFIFTGPKDSLLTIRHYRDKAICTVTLEYYLESATKERMELLTYEECMELESRWTMKVNMLGKRPKRSTTIPSIHRGIPFDVYFPTTDKRLLEYDIDEMVYNMYSPFQHIQIAHSKTYGNMLILDGDPNLADSDLIYTESLMRRGFESYENKEILILGGGDGGLLHELLKESPKHVLMIEIDEMVIDACRKYLRNVCGNVLDSLCGRNYEIIVDDCRPLLQKLCEQHATFDYIFDDLTTIPVNGNANEDKSLVELQKNVLESACALLKPNTGKLMAHGPGASGLNSTKLFEEILYNCVQSSSTIKIDKQLVFVPSFMESWTFYQVEVKRFFF